MNHSATVAADGATARELWENIAHYLQHTGLFSRSMEMDEALEYMLGVLRERIDQHGLETVLHSCAWAFLHSRPACRD